MLVLEDFMTIQGRQLPPAGEEEGRPPGPQAQALGRTRGGGRGGSRGVNHGTRESVNRGHFTSVVSGQDTSALTLGGEAAALLRLEPIWAGQIRGMRDLTLRHGTQTLPRRSRPCQSGASTQDCRWDEAADPRLDVVA